MSVYAGWMKSCH